MRYVEADVRSFDFGALLNSCATDLVVHLVPCLADNYAYLIHDLPEPPEGSIRERSMPASKAYTRFRRRLKRLA